jgi:hypothetical protein
MATHGGCQSLKLNSHEMRSALRAIVGEVRVALDAYDKEQGDG